MPLLLGLDMNIQEAKNTWKVTLSIFIDLYGQQINVFPIDASSYAQNF